MILSQQLYITYALQIHYQISSRHNKKSTFVYIFFIVEAVHIFGIKKFTIVHFGTICSFCLWNVERGTI